MRGPPWSGVTRQAVCKDFTGQDTRPTSCLSLIRDSAFTHKRQQSTESWLPIERRREFRQTFLGGNNNCSGSNPSAQTLATNQNSSLNHVIKMNLTFPKRDYGVTVWCMTHNLGDVKSGVQSASSISEVVILVQSRS